MDKFCKLQIPGNTYNMDWFIFIQPESDLPLQWLCFKAGFV